MVCDPHTAPRTSRCPTVQKVNTTTWAPIERFSKRNAPQKNTSKLKFVACEGNRRMPVAWSPKDERQYKAIVRNCSRSRKICKRIAAATVNKRRRIEGRTLSGLEAYVIEAKAEPGHPETAGWAPGWKRTCGQEFKTHEAARNAITAHGRAGARYRIKKGFAPPCPSPKFSWPEWLFLGLVGSATALALHKTP